MADLAHFALPLVCLAWLISGTIALVKSFRKGTRTGPKPGEEKAAPVDGPTPPPLPAVVSLKKRRLAAAGWTLAGLAGVWITGLSAGWHGWHARSESSLPPDLTRQVMETCGEFIREHDVPGLGVAVIAGDDQAVFGFGRRRLGGPPVEGDTHFEIGSITKVFTGILLAHALETGDVTLDQPVSELLAPDVTLPEGAPRAITLRQLTTHTAGIPRLPPGLLNPLSIGRQLVGGDPYAGYTHEDFHRNLAGLTLDAEPGAKMNYSNYGVALLGHALARRRGVSYDQLLRDELLAPLGMNDSAVTLDDAQEERFATGYRATFGIGRALVALRSLPWHLADHLAPAGGIRSTPRDMLRFLAVCMEREATPVSSAVKRSLEVLHRDNDHQAVGMNWLHTRVGPDDPTVLWHNGGTGGFRSYLGFTGDRRAGVVILANSKADTDSLGVRLVRLLHEHRSAPKPKP